MTEQATEIGSFLDSIWRQESAYVYVPTLNRRNGEWDKKLYKWPENKSSVIQRIISSNALGVDVYFAPVLFDRNKPPRPIKENVLGSYVIWSEFDGSAPSTWLSDPATAPTESLKGIPEPSIRVQSSSDGYEHVYWQLDVLCTDTSYIEDCNRSISYSTRADVSGWDINQVLRPPGTTNYKHDLPVTVIVSENKVYNVGDFAKLKPPKKLVQDSIDTENLPDTKYLVAKYSWDAQHFDLFNQVEIPEGERSSALMRLGYFCAEAGMSDTEAYSILLHADDRWKKYLGRADRIVRLVDIVNRARLKYPHAVKDSNLQHLHDEDDVDKGTQLIYGFREFLESDVEVEWAISDLVEVGGIGMVAAKPGIGKTQFSLQLGKAAAVGKSFLGWSPNGIQKIQFWSLEMSHVAAKKFITTMAQGYTEEEIDLLQRNFQIIPLGQVLALDRPEARKFMRNIIEEHKPNGIIIDSLNKLGHKSIVDDEVIGNINETLRRIRVDYKVWQWVIHHNRKSTDGNKKPTDLDDIYGNVYTTGDLTTATILWRDRRSTTPNEIEVIQVKNRLAPERDPFNITRDENLMFHMTAESTVKEMARG